MSTNAKRGAWWLTGICLILAIPLVAMQFTQEVSWSLSDFLVFGGLLALVGFTYEFGIRRLRSTTKKALMTLALICVFLLVWAELAVGIFGSLLAGS